MVMLICLTGALTQIRMGTAYITSPGMRLRRGQCAFLMSQCRWFMHFRRLVIILGFSASYFVGMIMPKAGRNCASNKNADQ